MTSAIVGLLGVVLGACLCTLQDFIKVKRENEKRSQYLGVRVSCLLDAFVDRCVDVAFDDGTYFGQLSQDGYAEVQVEAPMLRFEALDVDWKLLPPGLMYSILSFPNLIDEADYLIDSTNDSATPPEFAEFFEERQLQYCQLGISAADLSEKLRQHYSLPERPGRSWDPTEKLQEKKRDILKLRHKRVQLSKSRDEKHSLH